MGRTDAAAHQEPQTPLPRFQLITAYSSHLALAIYITMPFTLLVYMVRDFAGPEADEGSVSRQTGLLASLMNLSAFVTSIPWGLACDRLGRKPVLVVGNLSCALSMFLLGFSPSYGFAAFTRVFGGLLNGVLGAVKTVLADISDHTNQSLAFSGLSVAWGIGAVLGPTLGGMLARPCSAEGLLGPDSTSCCETCLLARFPYALACVTGAAFLAVSGGLAILTEETMPNPEHRIRFPWRLLRRFRRKFLWAVGLKSLATRRPRASARAHGGKDSDEDDEEGGGWLLAPGHDHEDGDGEGRHHVPGDVEMSEVAGKSAEAGRADGGATSGGIKCSEPPVRWYHDRNCKLTLVGYGLCAFIYIMIDELLPIFAAAPPMVGGLGFSPRDLSGPSAFGGIVVFIFSIWGFPGLNAYLGLRNMTIYGFVFTSVTAMLLPLPSLCVGSRTMEMVGLYGALGLRGAAAVTVFTNAMMLVNAAAPAGQLGEVNGVGQAVGAFVRGFGPELIGLIWSWFVESGWHGSQFGAWAFISVVSFGGVYTYQTVPFEELAARKQKGAAAASRSAAGAAGTSSSGDQQGGDGGDQPAPGTSSPTTDREQQQIEGLSSAWGLGGGAKSRRASADGRPPAGGGAVAASPPTTAAEPHGG